MAATLAPGRYKLAKTVTNPRADKRAKYDWHKLPEWRAGLIFNVTVASTLSPSEVPADIDPAMFGYSLLRPEWSAFRGSAVAERMGDTAVFDAIAPHLVPVNVDPVESFLRENDTETVLRRLLASGKVTLADLNEVV